MDSISVFTGIIDNQLRNGISNSEVIFEVLQSTGYPGGRSQVKLYIKEDKDLMGELDADMSIIETVILNGRNEKANRYLGEAVAELRHAFYDLSDALFEITTAPKDD